MLLNHRQVLLSGGCEVVLLMPAEPCPEIAVIEGKGEYYLFANATGFGVLAELFSLAVAQGPNEVIYCPSAFAHTAALEREMPMLNQLKGLVIRNFGAMQMDNKDIMRAIKTKGGCVEQVDRRAEPLGERPRDWDTWRRLTVKCLHEVLMFSGEREVLTLLARSCRSFVMIGDDARANGDHVHHDRDDNTTKSLGITLEYWHFDPVQNPASVF